MADTIGSNAVPVSSPVAARTATAPTSSPDVASNQLAARVFGATLSDLTQRSLVDAQIGVEQGKTQEQVRSLREDVNNAIYKRLQNSLMADTKVNP